LGLVTDGNGCGKYINVEIADIDCGPVGVDEFDTKSLNVYPNPFEGREIFLQIEDGTNVQVELFSITGAAIPTSVDSQGGSVYVVRPHQVLPSGLYMMKVTDGSETTVKRVVVKN